MEESSPAQLAPCLGTHQAEAEVSARLASHLEALGRSHVQEHSGLWQNPAPGGHRSEVPLSLLIIVGPVSPRGHPHSVPCGPSIFQVQVVSFSHFESLTRNLGKF